MKPYPAYKTSRLKWTERIPEHWDERRARFLFRAIDERSETGNEELLSVSHITGVTPRSEKNVNMFMAESYEGHKLCRPGDLVINSLWAWMAALGVSKHRGIVSSAYHVYRQRDDQTFDPAFLDYLLRTRGYGGEYLGRSKGVWKSRLLLTPSDFFDIPILTPPRAEQDAIVAFLEAKQREMQTFIANKRRMIELLKEQKTAFIHRAVTRGLNPNVPLKPSGIPLLGDIPKHWQAIALRRHWEVLDCKHVTVPFFDEGIPLASVVEVQNFELDLSQAKRTDRQHYEMLIGGDRRPRRGDLIYCRNASVGAAAYVDTDEELAMGQDVCLIRSDRHNGRFLNYQLNSWLMEQQLATILVGSTFKRINVAEIKALNVVVPPRPEQDEIVRHLDEANRTFVAATTTAEREIALMEEYRTALITAAVTGKIEVRQSSVEVLSAPRPNRHFARALLSAEVVHQLHAEPTFGRIKHQKILHLCEYIAGIEEIQGEYHREAAGPLDNKLIYSVEAELKKQKWFAEYAREKFGHGYRPLEKAGGHRAYVERYWKEKQPVIQRLIDQMRSWDTERCEIFSTAYAAWNDLLIWRKPVTDDAILHEILHRWHDRKKQVPESRWRKALEWMRKESFVPTGFGKPTAKCDAKGGD